MRVATRRLRAFLKAGAPLLHEEWAQSLRSELGWLGSSLGQVRDLDVLLDHLRSDADGLEPKEHRALRRVFRQLEGERAAARATMLAALASERYAALLDRLEEAARAPSFSPEADDVSLEDIAAHQYGKLRKAVRELDEQPSDERAAPDPDPRQAGALRGRARRAGRRQEGNELHPRGQGVPGRAGRAPGRGVRGREGARAADGARRGVDRVRSRPPRSSASASGARTPAAPSARPGRLSSGAAAKPGTREMSAGAVRAAGGVRHPDRCGRSSARCCSYTGRSTTTGRSRKGRPIPARPMGSARCAKSRRRRVSAASCRMSSARRATSIRRAARRPCATSRCARFGASSRPTTRSTRSPGSPSRGAEAG